MEAPIKLAPIYGSTRETRFYDGGGISPARRIRRNGAMASAGRLSR
jgi:hypothetical protein